MIDIGVASPSAHGQAMISTATALTSACASRGSGPNVAQTTNVTAAIPTHRRHEVARDHVGQPLDRRAAALRLGDHARRSARAASRAPTRSARITQRAGAVDGRADDAVARRLLDRDRLAGDHRLVDRARAFERPTPSTGTFSPGRTRSRSPTLDVVERHILFAAVGARGAARVLGASPSSARMRRAGPAARPQLQHLARAAPA